MSLTFKFTDTIPKPSIPVEKLNNVLVKMRKIVKAAKVLAFRNMLRYIKLLQKKVERDPANTRVKNKLEYRSLELCQLRQLTISRICKLLIASDYATDVLSREGSRYTGQDRLIIRLSRVKPVADYLKVFRQQHPDWRDLAQYLLYKNVSGKWKSREQKRRNRRVHGSLPLPKPLPNPHDVGDLEDQIPQSATISYRIHQSTDSFNSICATQTVVGRGSSPSLNTDCVESDTASDIADRLVSSLRARAGGETTDADALSVASTNNGGNPTCSSWTKFKKQKTVELSANAPPAVKRRSTQANELVRLGGDLTDKDDYNKDPFGSDDVTLRKSLSRGARKQLQNTSTYTAVPPHRHKQKPCVKKSAGKCHKLPERKRSYYIAQVDVPKTSDLHVESNKNLHPSWQAKREQNLRLHSIGNLMKASSNQAKHIVFPA